MTEPTQSSAAEMLGEMRALGRQAARTGHGYWLPLLIFGVLIAASLPLYLVSTAATYGYARIGGPVLPFLGTAIMPRYSGGDWIGLYWFVAMQAGIVATWLWYRWRGSRIGLRMPTRGFLVTGLAVVELALLVSLVAPRVGLPLFGDLFIRDTFPLVLIVVPLAVLAWIERSPALAVITVGYAGLALLASLYNVENILFRLGWNPFTSGQGSALVGLPNVALPALLLLLAGAASYAAGYRRRRRQAR